MERLRVRLFLIICLLIAGGCFKRAPEPQPTEVKALAVSLEAVTHTPTGETIKISNCPVLVVDEQTLVDAVVAIADLASLKDGIPPYHFDTCYQRLKTIKGYEKIATDAEGRTTVRGLRPDHFLVVRKIVRDEDKEQVYIWIVSARQCRERKLLLSEFNMGTQKFVEELTTRNALGTRLITAAEQALGRKQFFMARMLADNASYLGDVTAIEAASKLVPEVDKAEAADLRERAEDALSRKRFDEARRLARSAESLADPSAAAGLFVRIDQSEKRELALQLVQQSKDALDRKDFEKATRFAEMAQSVAQTDEGAGVLAEINRQKLARDRAEGQKILQQAEEALSRKSFEEARRMARTATGLSDTADVTKMLNEINRQDGVERLRVAEAAMVRGDFENARRLAKNAGVLADSQKVAALITEINRRDVAELRQRAEQALAVKDYDLANRLASQAKAAVPDELKEEFQALINQVLERAGGQVKSFSNGQAVESVAFSPDGRLALGGSRDELKMLDLSSGEVIWKIQEDASRTAFSPDGKYVLSGNRRVLQMLDAASGRTLWTVKGGVSSVAFSPDGRFALSGNLVVGLKVWDASTGQDLYPMRGTESGVKSVAVSPDGQFALSAGVGVIKQWDVQTGKEIRTLRGHNGVVNCVVISPDARYALSGSTDGTVRLWDLVGGQQVRAFLGHSGSVTCVAFSPDNRFALSGGTDNAVRLWNITNGEQVRAFGGHESTVECVAYSPDGKHVLSGSDDKTIRVWQLPKEYWR